MNRKFLKIFSHIMEILHIFYPNNPLFITFPFKLVNKYSLFPTILESAQGKPLSENVCYIKSYRNMGIC